MNVTLLKCLWAKKVSSLLFNPKKPKRSCKNNSTFNLKFEIWALYRSVYCVDFGESFKWVITNYLQTSASIQPLTSPTKFGLPAPFPHPTPQGRLNSHDDGHLSDDFPTEAVVVGGYWREDLVEGVLRESQELVERQDPGLDGASKWRTYVFSNYELERIFSNF